MKSAKRRWVGVILLCTVLSTVLVGVLSIVSSRNTMEKNARESLSLQCKYNQQKLNTIIGKIEQSVDSLSEMVYDKLQDVEHFKNSGEYVDEFTLGMQRNLEILSKGTNGCVSSYLRYNPDFTKPTSGMFLVKNDATGEFHAKTPTDLSKYEEDDTEHVGWYYETIKSRKATWMAPYRNANTGTYMVSYIVPIYIDNEAIGVVGMDIAFSYFQNIVNDISAYASGYGFLLNQAKEIIVHKSVAPYTSLYSIKKDELDGLIETLDKNTNTSGEYTYKGVQKLFVSDVIDNGMILCLSAPREEIFQSSVELTKKIGFSIIVCILLVTLIAYCVISRVMKLAAMDELTGLPNRKFFLDYVKRVRQKSQEPMALYIFDVDNFKQINDKKGHNAADDALRELAEVCRRVIGKDYRIARWGGDEFIGILPSAAAMELLRQLSQSIQESKSENLEDITISIGVADIRPENSFGEITERADHALYQSKQAGRNCLTKYDEEKACR